jgi:hypothetical protein
MTNPTTAEKVHMSQSREDRMVVVERDQAGIPTVWCDPEIADLVQALNAGGVRTVASCSGHGEKNGIISLKDGRELLVLPNYETARDFERHAELRQACWDARATLGFDNDGDPTPAALVYPTLAELVKRDAAEFRKDYDDALTELASLQRERDANAERYLWLRDNCKREWVSDMPHNKGAPSLDIDFSAPGHDLDASIDTARGAGNG